MDLDSSLSFVTVAVTLEKYFSCGEYSPPLCVYFVFTFRGTLVACFKLAIFRDYL